ncbi:hypothetical protein QN277_006219 [Acacia crassicarpa]|uniref:Uncharacterized protein n=1 Tax=Acacia crassicarpa TaxID=499986 RepID=A0AAE1MAI9_9FABA|nr:hypothetical protein QN277_006219 [Acacia crassicarpa]
MAINRASVRQISLALSLVGSVDISLALSLSLAGGLVWRISAFNRASGAVDCGSGLLIDPEVEEPWFLAVEGSRRSQIRSINFTLLLFVSGLLIQKEKKPPLRQSKLKFTGSSASLSVVSGLLTQKEKKGELAILLIHVPIVVD